MTVAVVFRLFFQAIALFGAGVSLLSIKKIAQSDAFKLSVLSIPLVAVVVLFYTLSRK